MGCGNSKIDKEEIVRRCKTRTRLMKQLVKSRQAFSASHNTYIISHRSAGTALLQFVTAFAGKDDYNVPPTPTVAPSSSRLETGDDWKTKSEVVTTGNFIKTMITEFSNNPEITSEIAVVMPAKSNDLVEIMREINELFATAADACSEVSSLLGVSSFSRSTSHSFEGSKVYGHLNQSLCSMGLLKKTDSLEQFEESIEGEEASSWSGSHSSTLSKLYAWEKKLYLEVKTAETLNLEYQKRIVQMRKFESRKTEGVKTEKTKKELEKLESRIMVTSQTIETISSEIFKLTQSDLYMHLVELVKGLMGMWRTMHECYTKQMHIAKQLERLINVVHSSSPSESHWRSTYQLEQKLQQWQLALYNLDKAQGDYVESLVGWLQLCNSPITWRIYTICEEWSLLIKRVPMNLALDGIKNLLGSIRSLMVQQEEEQKLERRLELIKKEVEKKELELKLLEENKYKYKQYSTSEDGNKEPEVALKQTKVESLRGKAEEERAEYVKMVTATKMRTFTILRTELAPLFQAMSDFARECTLSFEFVQDKAKTVGGGGEGHDVKMLVP
ncbi:protein ALTERED PHOSPHATE STARVATION RESPONSE 1-like [Impatiens glandulifera]|uniref:protein ALTERED PHOSPHATE STARVATION RESPONSE 1-like n=1 Tax=Impatiens glandulifera TaxID=253017 RepID=UPI001FB16CA9|nr:protein ALTERED PHOSPHATE STARVATION RESPONSE 1-like [Impatiens glandulifera]